MNDEIRSIFPIADENNETIKMMSIPTEMEEKTEWTDRTIYIAYTHYHRADHVYCSCTVTIVVFLTLKYVANK